MIYLLKLITSLTEKNSSSNKFLPNDNSKVDLSFESSLHGEQFQSQLDGYRANSIFLMKFRLGNEEIEEIRNEVESLQLKVELLFRSISYYKGRSHLFET